ncbi:hypothetical protein [Streptomyces sp. HSG2]|uniref:hypothetical protein n=1 Tax=Streptomyces sp. HSG2 TaxID=2797167 RepID=UPI001903AA6E|nr:hypothetical protein [Streptomyces sp. HSG2]
MTPGDGGFLESGSPGASYCYSGLRIAPDPAAAHSAAAAGLPEGQRRESLARAERAWLDGQWADDGRCWELRTIAGEWGGESTGGSGRLSCVLLARAYAADGRRARALAGTLSTGMSALPRHVRSEPMSREQTAAALSPFPGHLAHVVEVRRRIHWQSIRRSEAPFPVGMTLDPYPTEAVDWQPVWAELARTPGTVVLGVRLEPASWRVRDSETARRLAQAFEILSRPGRFNPAIGREEPGIPFAARAADFYAWLSDGAHVRRGYRMRVTLAADRPIPPELPEWVASVMSGRDGETSTGDPRPGPPAAVVSPVRDPEEVRRAWHAFATLHDVWLSLAHQQDVPVPLGEFERALVARVVTAETNAAFRFPYETPGRPPVFHPPAPPPPAARARAAPPGPEEGIPFPEPPAHFGRDDHQGGAA